MATTFLVIEFVNTKHLIALIRVNIGAKFTNWPVTQLTDIFRKTTRHGTSFNASCRLPLTVTSLNYVVKSPIESTSPTISKSSGINSVAFHDIL